MRTLFGMGWRLILFFVIAAALIVAPLFLVYHSRCLENGKREAKWEFVAPWDDPPSDCRHNQTGFDYLKDQLGI